MAANPRAVMRAMKAVAPSPSTGGYGNAPAPYIGPGPSPLVASYNDWGPYAGGRAHGTGSSLPRDWRTFLSGMFGPLSPLQDVPIDVPEPGQERPPPRRMNYPVGYNLQLGAPGSEGWGKLASFEVLRRLADYYSVARNAIELRKSELRGVGWDIAPTSQAAKAMRGDHRAAADFAERRAKAVRFFRKPDPDYSDFSSWFNSLLEEFFVTDAASIFLHPSRVEGKGLLGSSVAALDVIDGTQAKPLLDVRGGKPAPPNPAFQIMNFGVPRVDLMTLLADQEQRQQQLDEGSRLPDDVLAEYRGDQFMYLPFSRRSWTPYGQSGVERALIPIMMGINKQNYQMQYYAEGSIPGVYISPGDTSLTPSQLRELQDAFNAIGGDIAWKHKIIVTPGGSKVDPMRPNPLADDFDTLVQIQTCMGFDVQPFELGIIPQLSAAAASSGSARQTIGAHVDIRSRKSTVPILLFFKLAIFDRVLQDVCGMWDMEWSWSGLEEQGNEDILTELLTQQVSVGMASIDEARQALGRDPWGLPITSDPGWATQWGGFVPLTGVTEATATPMGGSPGPGGPGGATVTPDDHLTPGGSPRSGGPSVPTVPRNRMSSSQRREQARQVTATQNSTGQGTPAHSGAQAAGRTTPMRTAAGLAPPAASGRTSAAKKSAVREAITGSVLESADNLAATPPGALTEPEKAERELGLLRSHLRRGGAVSAWQPRFIPPRLLSGVAENMAKGMDPGQACDVARTLLGAAAKGANGYSLNRRSGMISLDLPEGLIAPVPGGVTDHHVTVVYLGPDVDDEAFAAACAAVQAVTSLTPPLTGTIGGIGSFPLNEDGVPVWAAVDVPGIDAVHAALAVLQAPTAKAREHGYKPHMTLAYLGEGDPLPPAVPDTAVTFTHLSVHRGGDVEHFPFGGAGAAKASEEYATCAQGHKHWGAHGAAGLLIRAKGGDRKWRYLLHRRGETSDHPGTWGVPGGALHEGEPPAMGAIREATEELGVMPNLRPHHIVTDDHGGDPGWAYHTVVTDAPEIFQPTTTGTTSHETGGWAWMTAREVEQHPLHPGFAASWQAVRRSRTTRALKDAADLTDPSPVEAEHVANQLRRNYPEKALRWVRGARWIGPVQIPHDRIDYGDVDSWAASHQPQAVKRFAREIRHGRGHLHPVVAVQEPGESRVKVIDGHHRTLAYRKLGLPVKAYVGLVDSNGGPWDETHSYQFHAGGGEASKAAKIPKESVNYRPAASKTRRCGTCVMFRPLAPDFESGHCTLVEGLIEPGDVCDRWEPGQAGKSERTPIVSTVHNPLGHEGLWHTPDRHVATMQQLPAYFQNTARAIAQRDGGDPEDKIAEAVAAVREWSEGTAFGGKVKVTPEVQAAAQRAMAEWAGLKASHHS